ncbi:unnamed protein product [Mytilus edulis]|uniref:Homeobox domain-containing protein n=1 Tax=Mytilus edulis TaxID=6550 RepID=A0A8S3UE22_MYTED|nr:unnamed protein product [Mytilus edulis]
METTQPKGRNKHFVLKKRRRRTIINSKDLEKLESLFKTSKWPDRAQKVRLSKAIGKTENFISTWFQNRRARMRRLARQKDLLDDVDVGNPKSQVDLKITDVPEDESSGRLHKYRSRSYSFPNIHLNDTTSTHELEVDSQDDDTTHTRHDATLDPSNAQNTREQLTVSPREERKRSDQLTNTLASLGNKNTTFVKMTKAPNDVVPSERRILVETPKEVPCSTDSTSWDNVFRRIVDMMAASESVMPKSDASFPFAVKDAALGIRLKDGKLFYSKQYGLDFEDSN